jgi:hypothetical protein
MVKAWIETDYDELCLSFTIRDELQGYRMLIPFETPLEILRHIEGHILQDLNEQVKSRGTINPYNGKVIS